MKVAALLLALACGACGSDTAVSPTRTQTPTPAPTVTLYTITGLVSSLAGGTIPNSTVTIVDGPNAGLTSTTDGSGRYTLSGLTFAGFSMSVSAPGFIGSSRAAPLTAGATTATINFALLPSAVWRQAGTGNNVFTMPSYFSRVRIVGTYMGHSSNFVIRIGGRLVINELVGTGWQQTRHEGVYLTSGGTVEITNSSGVAWSMTEER